MSGPPHDPEQQRRVDRLELWLAALLGVAAIATAFAAYQGALKSGDSIKEFNHGIRSINDANTFFTQSNQLVARDQQLFLEYAKAKYEEKDDLARYIRVTLMEPNLRAGLREWERSGDDGPLTPLDAKAYKVEDADEGTRLEKQTNRQFDEAARLDDRGDRYDLITVILAVALFFFGIAGVLRVFRTKLVLAAMGSVVLIGGLVMLATV
jgi:hypothetical protein